ncbi:putative phage tail protein [Paenibacillus luteus]|uniref:putative phage tail protein n=1 Tax=Paenibacillus luteus TaxID=2545753 RepID=UPI001F4F8EFE|nr:putative phage tail protein [Paenibacillus luteus]
MREATLIKRDMHDYVPRYYEDIPVATNVLDREAAELAQLNADICDVLAQMFVDTSTWGLARWERIFGITTDIAKPIDQRRSVVKSRLRGVGTVTPAMIKSIAEAYSNGTVEVTEFGTNLLPPFNSGWVLHENTRMMQANFVGKIRASTVANANIGHSSVFTSLVAPSGYSSANELSQTQYDQSSTLNGVASTVTTLVNGGIAQDKRSIDAIENVIRRYGVGVFGSASTVTERLAWLKVNIAKMVLNAYVSGVGPLGNKAKVAWWTGAWTSSTGGTWENNAATITKVSPITVNGATAWFDRSIDDTGFVHILAYCPDGSNGTIASTINVDFIELEIYLKDGSVPPPDHELTLNATASGQISYVDVPVVGGQTYTTSLIASDLVNCYLKIQWIDSAGTVNGGIRDGAITGAPSFTFTTNVNAVKLRITFYSITSGLYTFKNPQLERGSVRTPFEGLPDYTIGIKFISSLGIPPNIADLEAAIRDALPAHLAVRYEFTYITFGQLAGYGVTYGAIEAAGLTFGQLETWEGP